MNPADLIPYVFERFTIYILVFSRISALLTTFILFRDDMINRKVLLSFGSILSIFVLVFMGNNRIAIDVFSLRMIIEVFFQMFIGFIMGLILNIIFEVFAGVGQVISGQIGLGLASLFDPKLGTITTLTQFYMISVMLLFLLLNGHLFVIETMINSFSIIPIGNTLWPEHLINNILNYSGIIFSGSILLSITVIVAILATNFSLALMTKFAPQFNLFSIGINMTLVLGLICVYLTFGLFIDQGTNLIQDGLVFLTQNLGHLK